MPAFAPALKPDEAGVEVWDADAVLELVALDGEGDVVELDVVLVVLVVDFAVMLK
jgi:hypothetical protein